MPPSLDQQPALTLVRGGREPAQDIAVDELSATRGAVRSGDRHEPWTLEVDAAVRRIHAEAGRLGLDFEIAVRLVAEAALAATDLGAVGVAPGEVDAIAATTRVDSALDAAESSYLRRLVRPEPNAPTKVSSAVTVGLPMRLTTRLLARELPELLASTELERALAWEIAAISEGRMISDWVPWAVLRARSAQAD